MPTTNIIGYLWSKRQELDLDGLPDVIQMVADLQRHGLECIRADDLVILGQPTGHTSVELIMHTPEEWAWRVEDAIVSSAVEHALDMLDGDLT